MRQRTSSHRTRWHAVLLCLIPLACFRPYFYETRLYDLNKGGVLSCAWHRLEPGRGEIIATGRDGEAFRGEYLTQSNRSANATQASVSANATGSSDSVYAWARANGVSFSDPGMQFGTFVMVGDNGTVIEGAYQVNPYDPNGAIVGVGRSNTGGQFRLMGNYKIAIHEPPSQP